MLETIAGESRVDFEAAGRLPVRRWFADQGRLSVALFHWLSTQALCWKSSTTLLTVCPFDTDAEIAAATRIASRQTIQ